MERDVSGDTDKGDLLDTGERIIRRSIDRYENMKNVCTHLQGFSRVDLVSVVESLYVIAKSMK